MAGPPYDSQVHYAKKGTTSRIGYKVHRTGACDEGGHHLITHVETTPAPVADRNALDTIHDGFKARDLLPDTHLVDAGYVAADQLVAKRWSYSVTPLGPVARKYPMIAYPPPPLLNATLRGRSASHFPAPP